ncbi:MAG: DUF6429 family protein [Rhizomicrobium sp.]
MTVDEEKIDEAALALLHLTLHDGFRAWKNFDWAVLSRLHAKGFIGNPVNKSERSFNPTLLIAGRDAQDAW